jgi:hypothetical protein
MVTESFPSVDFAGLKDVDRLGALPVAAGQHGSLRRMCQALELCVGRSSEARSRAWALLVGFCEGSLFYPGTGDHVGLRRWCILVGEHQ